LRNNPALKAPTATFSESNPQLDEARRNVAGARCWVISDGKAGDEAQCLGVAERLGLSPEVRRIAPRPPYTWAMPWGPIDPREAPAKAGSPVAPPWPDIAIASGRRTVAYLRRVKKEAGNQTLTVFLKDPRIGTGAADLIWVPEHDGLRGTNVISTLTSPHRISPERLAQALAAPTPWQNPDKRPVTGVLLGGDSQHHRFSKQDIAQFVEDMATVATSGSLLAVTPSRRTPDALASAIRMLTMANGGWWWDGTVDNPYMSILAHSDSLIVTADSVNMLGEAAATGKPIQLFTPTGGHAKISSFVTGLSDHGAVRPLGAPLARKGYAPLDATPVIAVAVAKAFKRLHG
jgi:uncharacterized protein